MSDSRTEAQVTDEDLSAEDIAERRRKRTVLRWASILVFFQSGSYSVIIFRTAESPQSFVAGAALFAVAVTVAVNLVMLRRDGNLSRAMVVFVLTGLANVVVLLTPTLDNTAIYWIPSVTSIAFYLTGYRRGLILSGIYFGAYFLLIACQAFGVVSTPYTLTQLVQMSVAAGCVFLFGLLGEATNARFRREIVAQRERLNAIVRRMPLGVIVFDAPDGLPSASNAAAETLLGAPIDPTVPLSRFHATYRMTDADGSRLDPAKLPIAQALYEGRSDASADVRVAAKGVAPRVLHTVSAPIPGHDGKIAAAVAVFEDVTKRVEVDRMKTEFLSLASHQLKTPLTSIAWALESVLEDAKKLPADQRKTLEMAHEASSRMGTLVRELLNISRIETGRKFDIVPVPTDIIPVLKEVAGSIQGLAEQRRIKVSVRALPASLVANADPDKIREAFMNLVSNAVKYSKDGGTVELGATATAKDVTISIRDAGIGIPEEYQDRIFSKFYRAPNVLQGIEGTGLGLYIVKVIIDRHDGKVWFESKEGKGTTFYVKLGKAA